MRAQVVVSSDVRGIVLSIPQGMNGHQLAKFREANKVALDAARVAAKAGEPVSMVIECESSVVVPAEASEQTDEGDTSVRQGVPQIDCYTLLHHLLLTLNN